MKAIYDFHTIQIEMTNACIHSCSNCTRFCGHHKKPFFMDWETFKRAVDSLEDWPRRIGIMGGEPTLHPEFERFVKYARKVHPEAYDIGGGKKPVKSLSRYIEDVNVVKSELVTKLRGLGLWSSVCASYVKHYEIIQDSFIFQCVNDHTASSRHQAWLMTRKEFGINDTEWIKIRDNCWWQRCLNSPSVTPKGAFFCEVAAAMDLLFDGPGGWKIEKNWWRRGPEDYKDQLFWCEYCAGAFADFDRDANEEIDDVSPVMFDKLVQAGSPKVQKPDRICIHKTDETSDVRVHPRQEVLMYQDDYSLRVTEDNQVITPNNIFFGNMKDYGNGKLGQLILSQNGWIALAEDMSVVPEARQILEHTTFNPGTFHYIEEYRIYFFHTNARSIRRIGIDGLKLIDGIEGLRAAWLQDRVFDLPAGFEGEINPDIEEWRHYITTNGMMSWYGLYEPFASIEYRSTLFPKVDNISNSELGLVEKIEEYLALDVGYSVSSVLCNKYKTIIQNDLAKELYDNNFNIQRVMEKLKNSSESYLKNYALSLLTTRNEKCEFLLEALADPRNVFGLGLHSLLSLQDQEMSVMEDIISKIQNSYVILGNRYQGKSLQMIGAHMKYMPVCMADEERHGYTYGGTTTLTVREAVEKAADNTLYIMCAFSAVAEELCSVLDVLGKEAIYFGAETVTELTGSPYYLSSNIENVISIASAEPRDMCDKIKEIRAEMGR